MRLISTIFQNTKNILHVHSVDHIQKHDLVHRYDMFDLDVINDLFQSKGVPAMFLSDHIIQFENFYPGVKFIGLPLWLERQRKDWNLEEFDDKKTETNYCFNFMINKKQINRYLCIKLVELFKFKNFTYTWSGVDTRFDCSVIIKEHNDLNKLSPLTTDQFGKILSPIAIGKFFYHEIQESTQNNGSAYPIPSNHNSWNLGCNKLFFQSAVSLITESLSYQKASAFTEKTLYSVLGLNFPIWVGGGNCQAEMWKKLGFDVFDDVINHDYQHYDTLLERCVYAFTLNKEILTDIDYATSLRNANIERLKNNRSLILSGKLSDYIKNELETHLPSNDLNDSFRDALNQLLKKFNIDNYQLELP